MKKIDHIALQVEEPKQAAEWYCENFGAKLLYADDTWSFVQFQNIKLAFVTKGQHPPHNIMKKIAFWQKNTDKRRIQEGWLVEDKETKFVVKCGNFMIEHHYPHASHAYKIIEE